jgi:palmitoyl-protein thioesterase
MKSLIAALCLVSGVLASKYNLPVGIPEGVGPKTKEFLHRAVHDTDAVLAEIAESPVSFIVEPFEHVEMPTGKVGAANSAPLVFGHGMGDSCFNAGMKQITELSGKHLGVYSVCVPTGATRAQDTIDGFLMNMDKSIDVFAAKIKADKNLAGGFHGVGFSQGNSLIRGYIHKYNDPPVLSWLSVHGTGMGVAGFPNCPANGTVLSGICDLFDEVLGEAAYLPASQNILFQAGYFRDPMRLNTTAYKTNSMIAQLNNENVMNATYKSNFESVKNYFMIRAMKDTMVWPSLGEWWGQYTPGTFKTEQTITETYLYDQDLFGLKTVYGDNKVLFNHTDGNHLQFTNDQLFWWLDNYVAQVPSQ